MLLNAKHFILTLRTFYGDSMPPIPSPNENNKPAMKSDMLTTRTHTLSLNVLLVRITCAKAFVAAKPTDSSIRHTPISWMEGNQNVAKLSVFIVISYKLYNFTKRSLPCYISNCYYLIIAS